MLRSRQVGVVLVALVAGCGGSEQHDAIVEGMRAETSSGPRRQALAVPAGADRVAGASKLLDFAESTFPQLFPGHESNRVLSGIIYRYYPQTAIYLAVIDWRVYAMGGPLGPEIRDFGPVDSYVSIDAPIGNKAPTVALSPISGGPFTAPASVTLTAAAVDSDGSITKVVFKSAGAPIGQATSAPWSMVWSGIPAGTYVVTAEATDDQGSTTVSAPISLSVTAQNRPPSVSVLAPLSETAGQQIQITALASDPDGSIAVVEFFSGSTKIGQDTTPPFAISWTPAAGTYSITAKATDNLGISMVSEARSITITPSAPTLAGLYGRLTFTYTFGQTYTDVVNYSAADLYGGDTLIDNLIGSTRLMACGLTTASLRSAGYEYLCRAEFTSGNSDQYLFRIVDGQIVGNYNYCSATRQTTSECASDLLTRPDAALRGSLVRSGLAVSDETGEGEADSEKLKQSLKSQMPIRPLDSSDNVKALEGLIIRQRSR